MSCVCTMGTVEAQCDAINAPGLDRKLFATCQDELLAIPAPATDSHVISSPITYRAAAAGPPAVAAGKFYEWHFAQEDQTWECTQDENGLWNTNVVIFISKLTPAKTQVLKGMGGENKVVITNDRNQNKRIIGDLSNGCKMMVKEQSTPKSGYVVTISWQSPTPPYYYTGTITV